MWWNSGVTVEEGMSAGREKGVLECGPQSGQGLLLGCIHKLLYSQALVVVVVGGYLW